MFAKWMFQSAALICAVLLTVGFRPPPPTPFPDLDKRPRAAAPVAAGQQQAANDLRALAPDATVQFDAVTHSAAHVTATRGFLSGPGGRGRAVGDPALNAVGKNDPHRATKAFLSQHRALFGHGPEALDAATVKRDFTTAHNGLHSVVWAQRVDDIPVFEGVLMAHTTARGELVSISSQFAADTARAALLARPNRAAALTGAQAVERAAASLNVPLAVADVVLLEQVPGAEQKHRFQSAALVGDTTAELVWLPMNQDELRLCWNVVLKIRSRGETFRALVDAQTGEVLVRRCLTAYLTNSTYHVFTSDSPSPFSPGHPTPLTTQPTVIPRSLVTFAALNTNASPAGWISDTGNETLGNNADAHLDRNDNDLPDLPRPQGSPFHVFDPALDLALSPLNSGDASVVQLFYWCNFMHDQLYELGFTEAAGNFQADNFGRGGLGNDPVQADAQDGASLNDGFHVNNANMDTHDDGIPPRMQMYLFSGPSPDRDGSFDAEIVLHEYTHGLSTRLVGGGLGITALQSEGMGEGWSDFYALALLSEPGDDVNATYAMAGYATYQFSGLLQNYYYGIRRYPYSTDLTKSPLTFRDIDPTQASSHPSVPVSPVFGGGSAAEVHNQGEIWCVVLWEARANLITKHGWTNGNRLILQLVTDGMKLSPVNPTFLQARDAIIMADQIYNAGANFIDLWTAFAKRGMGFTATSPSSSTTTGVHEAFDLPDALNVTPNDGFVSSGPAGGPFSITNRTYTLGNLGSNALTWSALSTVNWLNVSAAGGALATGATVNVTVSLNGAAGALATGIYSAAVRFTNVTSGIGQSRAFTLRVGQPDYFSELFTGNMNLTNVTFTFTPNGSVSFYGVCRESATNFPTDPSGGNVLTLTDDSFFQVSLTGTNHVSLYGRVTNIFEIGSNGYLTIGGGDTEYSESFTSHFARPRISALFRDLLPTNSGAVSWKQLPDRMAVTYQDVREYVQKNTNNFQVEWFFDGRIRITWLKIDAVRCLVGLSAGPGLPAGFDPSDFNSYKPCAAVPFVSLSRTGTNAVITWNTTPGRAYRVEVKPNLAPGATWTNAGPDLTATGLTCAITNGLSGAQQFYRVLLLP